MKKVSLFAIVLVVAALGCNKTKNSGYIYLNAEQLKPLGIELTADGAFYKNNNPAWIEDKERFPVLGFYSTNNTYMKSMHYMETDTITPKDRIDSIYVSLETTKNDFYPFLIGSIKGHYSLDRQEKNIELVPIAICMAETKLSKRTDTLLVWFKPTKSLSKALPNNIKVEDYLRLPDPEK